MVDIINTLCALLTIGFGLFGFVAPRYTASALDLEPTKSTMGLSEMRASVGGLFVVAGLGALWLDDPVGYAMIGFAFVGAATGRVAFGGLTDWRCRYLHRCKTYIIPM